MIKEEKNWTHFHSIYSLFRILTSFVELSYSYIRHGMFRGRQHVSESAYESLYDSVHDLYANRIGSQLFFCYPLQRFVYTFQPKKVKS
jgi:hypothetical protein